MTPAPSIPTLNVVGGGRLGRTLARLWQEGGVFTVQDVLSRTQSRADEAVAFIGAGRAVTDLATLRRADIYLISTADDGIVNTVATLAQAGLLGPGVIVFHCSGALSSRAMQAAIDAGSSAAGVHPIRSFADPAKVVREFAGTWCGIEGDAAATAMLDPAFRAIGAQTVPIDASQKMLYHAAAVFASNYLVTLIDVGLQAYERAGIPRDTGLKMLEPLVRKTVDDVFRIGPEQALQGPIARGDMATVERQRQAVEGWNASLGSLYGELAEAAQDLARRKRELP